MSHVIQNHVLNQISDRCLRCYDEQKWYGENFLFDYIGDSDVIGNKILEIGCAEAGLMKFYNEKGAICSGLELSDTRYKNAVLLNDDKSIHLFQADICKPETYENHIREGYDTIIIRDVIEHIPDQQLALENIHAMLKPGGKLFISFPPKYCPYAGHQQTIPKLLGKIPYLHLLPNFIYVYYLRLIGCPEKKIEYLLDTKETRISITRMKSIIKSIGYATIRESNWIIRPAYLFRFGFPKVLNPFSWVPILNEILCNGVLFLLIKEEA